MSLQPYLPGVLGTIPSSRPPTWSCTLDLSRPPDSDTHFPAQPHCRASAQHTQSQTPGFLSLLPSPAAAPGPVSSRPPAHARSPEPVWVLHTSKTCHAAFKTRPASDTCHLPRHAAARPSSASLGSSQRGLGKTGLEPLRSQVCRKSRARGLGHTRVPKSSWQGRAPGGGEGAAQAGLDVPRPARCLPLLEAPALPRAPTHLGAGSAFLPAHLGLLRPSCAPGLSHVSSPCTPSPVSSPADRPSPPTPSSQGRGPACPALGHPPCQHPAPRKRREQSQTQKDGLSR